MIRRKKIYSLIYTIFILGDITQKGYEKKRNKLLTPFIEKLSSKQDTAATAPTAAAESSSTPAAAGPSPGPSAAQAHAASSSPAASGSSSSSGSKLPRPINSAAGKAPPSTANAQLTAAEGAAAAGSQAKAASPPYDEGESPSDSNKPRSRRTHRRYYNEKRYHSEVKNFF